MGQCAHTKSNVAVIGGDILIGNLKQIFFKIKKNNNKLVDLCQLYNTVETKKGFAVTLDELPL